MTNPIMVEATRGQYPELYFRGAAAVVDANGRLIRQWGDVDKFVFGRSALKWLQVIPLIESGAADAYHLTSEEIALACGSHQAEEGHMEKLEAWLQKLGKTEKVLECGTHPLLSLRKRGTADPLSPLQNSCSGKHLAFISTALYRNETLKGYSAKEHPVQQRLEQALSELTGMDLHSVPKGIDGCGIPAYAIPLFNIASAMAQLADPSRLHYPRQKAIQRILESIKKCPDMIAGTDAFDTQVIKLTKGTVLSKSGEGGMEIGVIPSLKLGIALKIDDGNKKASELAFLTILHALGCIDEEVYELLNPRVPVLTHKGKTVGFMQSTHFAHTVSDMALN